MALKSLASIHSISDFTCSDLSPDHSRLSYGSEDSKVRIFNSENLHSDSCILISCLTLSKNITSLRWSPEKYGSSYALAVGTIDGVLNIIIKNPDSSMETWMSIVATNIHMADIKDIQWTHEHLLSAGIDNFLIVSTINYENSYYSIMITRRIALHDGWVTGISVSENWLISQGSDNMCKVWKYPSIELTFVLKFDSENMPIDLTKKPCIGKLIALAGCSSGVTGFPCLTMINPNNWQVFEIHLQSYNCISDGLKRSQNDNTFANVKCSVFCENKLYVASSEGVHCIDTASLSVLWHESVNVQIVVRNR